MGPPSRRYPTPPVRLSTADTRRPPWSPCRPHTRPPYDQRRRAAARYPAAPSLLASSHGYDRFDRSDGFGRLGRFDGADGADGADRCTWSTHRAERRTRRGPGAAAHHRPRIPRFSEQSRADGRRGPRPPRTGPHRAPLGRPVRRQTGGRTEPSGARHRHQLAAGAGRSAPRHRLDHVHDAAGRRPPLAGGAGRMVAPAAARYRGRGDAPRHPGRACRPDARTGRRGAARRRVGARPGLLGGPPHPPPGHRAAHRQRLAGRGARRPPARRRPAGRRPRGPRPTARHRGLAGGRRGRRRPGRPGGRPSPTRRAGGRRNPSLRGLRPWRRGAARARRHRPERRPAHLARPPPRALGTFVRGGLGGERGPHFRLQPRRTAAAATDRPARSRGGLRTRHRARRRTRDQADRYGIGRGLLDRRRATTAP